MTAICTAFDAGKNCNIKLAQIVGYSSEIVFNAAFMVAEIHYNLSHFAESFKEVPLKRSARSDCYLVAAFKNIAVNQNKKLVFALL